MLDRDFAEAVASVRSLEPDAIFLLLPWSQTETIERCAETFMTLPVEIHIGPEQILHKFEEVKLSKLGPVTSLQLTRRPLTRTEIARKRLFDLVAAAVALIALTPVLLAVAALVWLDSPGPVFFVQRRYGFNQQPFRIIKFRTMRTLDDGPVIAQATRNDPRLTRLGRFLRRWNIDEIPQLFNVLTGDMSLVGPRPHALTHDRRISAAHLALCAPPQRQAGHHRLGANPRLPRRDRYRRENAPAPRARPVLYRQLVALARSADHLAHRAVAGGLSQRLLRRPVALNKMPRASRDGHGQRIRISVSRPRNARAPTIDELENVLSRRGVAMATTAPAVTSAVDSQSTPIKSHTGRGLPPVLAGALVQDSSAGSARRSTAVAASMSATSRAS